MNEKLLIHATLKAKEIINRSDWILYNPNWTLLEQNQLHGAVELAKLTTELVKEIKRLRLVNEA